MKTKTLLCLAILQLSLLPCPAQSKWKLTLKVVDEDGKPVRGAEASVAEAAATSIPFGKTRAGGRYSASGTSWGPLLEYGARKKGYYPTEWLRWMPSGETNGQWLPWNPELPVLLRKIGHPTAMYARRLEIRIPEANRPIGLDLMEGAWVAPYGTGIHADFLLELTKRVTDLEDFEVSLTLSFPKEGDGIQEYPVPDYARQCTLRLPALAPEDGYRPTWTRTEGRQPGRAAYGIPDPDRNFYFRVRSVTVNGKVLRGFYGKIYGDIKFLGKLQFTYYLNPDGTRNVEFDPKKNLFQKLKPLEEPRWP
jgi:hypothetical protein